jgi:hypothetical protein
MKSLTPVLMVEEIEPVVAFWEALGFVKTFEVPDGDSLAFIGLQSGPVEIIVREPAGNVVTFAEMSVNEEEE